MKIYKIKFKSIGKYHNVALYFAVDENKEILANTMASFDKSNLNETELDQYQCMKLNHFLKTKCNDFKEIGIADFVEIFGQAKAFELLNTWGVSGV